MPRKPTNAKPKKFRRRPKRLRRPRMPLATSNKPFPLIRFAKLRYYEEILINPTSGSVSAVGYRANGMYDPLHSTGGHQPMGFDQLMLLYDHFEVYGSKITASFLPNGDQYHCGVYIDDDPTAPGGITQIMEQRGTNTKFMATTATRPTVAVKRYSQIKTYGKPARGSDSQKGSASADPTESTIFQVWAAGVGGADPGAVIVLIEVEYFAKFSELRTLAQS